MEEVGRAYVKVKEATTAMKWGWGGLEAKVGVSRQCTRKVDTVFGW